MATDRLSAEQLAELRGLIALTKERGRVQFVEIPVGQASALLAAAEEAERLESALVAANERAEWAEEELSKAKQYGAPVSGAVRRSSLPSKTCEHNDYWTTNYGHCMACRAEQAEAKHRITLDLWEQAEAENKRLRRMLAIVYAGSALYGDDGELHDGRGRPHIDFKRDDATDIEAKMRERANAALRPADAGEGVG